MAKKDVDFEKELEKLARKTNVNIKKTEYAYESQLKKLDDEIDRVANKKVKEFDKNKQLTLDYLSTDYTDDSISRYREKLNKI